MDESLGLLDRRRLMKALNLARKFSEIKDGARVESYTMESLAEIKFTSLLADRLQLSASFVKIILFVMSGFSNWNEANAGMLVSPYNIIIVI